MTHSEIKSLDDLDVTLTIDQVAELLKVSKASAYRFVKDGGIKCMKVGKQIRVSRKALKEFIEAS